MPIANYFVNVGEPPKPRFTYSLAPFGPLTPAWQPDDAALLKAREYLKGISRELDSFHGLQKECAADKNYEAARFYRGLIQDQQKRQRAWQLAIGFFVDEKALPFRPMQYWPVELADECDRALAAIALMRFDS